MARKGRFAYWKARALTRPEATRKLDSVPIAREFTLRLPDWVDGVIAKGMPPDADAGMRMRFVLDLVAGQIRHGTGGPFAAAVFDMQTGALISVGLNLVVAQHVSVAHAEVVALALAGQRLGTHDLADTPAELFTSTEPCAMCLGAVPWSGVQRIVCSASEEDARRIGFDEGDKPADWPSLLRARGIEVIRDVLRPHAVKLLDAYLDGGGTLYGPTPDTTEGAVQSP